jgi:hypothetical protein
VVENVHPIGEQSRIYVAPESSPRTFSDGGDAAPVTATATMVAPTDRVRWGAIVAGLLAALSTLAVLSVLGLALGLSSYDQGDSARAFGIRAGVWGAVSALLSFVLGGWVAARTAAVRGQNNGMLNGAMVWALAVPLLAWMTASGVAAATNAAGRVAGTAAQTAAAASDNPQVQDAARDASGQVKAKANEVAEQAKATANDPAAREKALDAARTTAWGTLASLLLALGAATVGGLLGARSNHPDRGVRVAAA